MQFKVSIALIVIAAALGRADQEADHKCSHCLATAEVKSNDASVILMDFLNAIDH